MCAIIGVYNDADAATLAYLGLYSQQHRGQESAGIVSYDGDQFHIHQRMGHVSDIFDENSLESLKGQSAIGHVRYSTAGESTIKNTQPFMVNCHFGTLALAHNGNIVNAIPLKKEFESKGAIFQSTMDTEVIVHLLAHSQNQNEKERLKEILSKIEGAFSLVFLTEDKMIAARDLDGIRPLVIGQKGDAFVVASETCALDLMNAKYVRDVKPGEIVIFDKNGMNSDFIGQQKNKRNQCIFEYVYFSRPDSQIFGRDVYNIRKGFGKELAKNSNVEADIVVPVPDSGLPSAIGYAQESGISFELGLIRNHYVGRTFIEPEQNIRDFSVRVKLNAIPNLLKDKRVILVDDSIVRGTTSRKIIQMIREAGAKEVHMRISSPPTKWPCFYGIDTPQKDQLIASSKDIESIREFIEADTLQYLSVDSLYWFDKSSPREWFCDACFTGNYKVGKEHVENLLQK